MHATVQTVDPPFARAIPSHAFFAIIEAMTLSLPEPMPETIWFEQTFAKPHTRTHPVELQNQVPPLGAVGVDGGAPVGVGTGAVGLFAAEA